MFRKVNFTFVLVASSAAFFAESHSMAQDQSNRIQELEAEVTRLESELKSVYAFLGVIQGNEEDSLAAIRLPTAKTKGPTSEFHWRVYVPPKEFSPDEFKLVAKTGRFDEEGVLQGENVVDGGELSVSSKDRSFDATVRCYWNDDKFSFFIDSEMMKSSAQVDIRSDHFNFVRNPRSAKALGLVQYYEGKMLGSPIQEENEEGILLLELVGDTSDKESPNCIQLWLRRD